MVMLKWIIVVLTVLNAGYMVVDGVRAIITGSYITPSSGEHAGQLGPWTRLVEAVGIESTSTLMKLVFIGYGATWLVVLGFFLAGARWAPVSMLALAICSLWYLWMGTINSMVQIIVLAVLLLKK